MMEPATSSLYFEQGPIRPPNEARSLLLRFTRNCLWNRCMFCPVYKRRKFSLRSVEDIRADIETARIISDDITAVSVDLGYNGSVTDAVISRILNTPEISTSYRSVALWRYYGTGACFLQDADNLIMKTDDLVEVLCFLRETFPEVRRVTTYTRSRTVIRKSIENLRRIREAGLDRIHIGLESGSDAVLKFMKKGVTAAQHIQAGHNALAAGMELSEYVMPGLGGKKLWRIHAEETARVLNQINPHFIRLRSLRVPKRVPLYEKLQNGSFRMQTDDHLVREIGVFISGLENITSTITSDHFMNLLEDVSGTLPEDKQPMLDVIQGYLNLSARDRMIYRIGRRGGAFRSTSDLTRDPETVNRIETLISEVEAQDGVAGVEQLIAEMVDQYV
ncbi:Radical SAM domain protein [Olavius algarvensis associated proteobacterium Delta 3]|nr:Radical SAM domain protein [Olavius algarvensis associated proteobacterium Delta 3]